VRRATGPEVSHRLTPASAGGHRPGSTEAPGESAEIIRVTRRRPPAAPGWPGAGSPYGSPRYSGPQQWHGRGLPPVCRGRRAGSHWQTPRPRAPSPPPRGPGPLPTRSESRSFRRLVPARGPHPCGQKPTFRSGFRTGIV
jgi:hypothetical protein